MLKLEKGNLYEPGTKQHKRTEPENKPAACGMETLAELSVYRSAGTVLSVPGSVGGGLYL